MSPINIVGYVLIIAGILCIITAAFFFRRRTEVEVSQSLINLPLFKIGAVGVVIGIVVKIVGIFI